MGAFVWVTLMGCSEAEVESETVNKTSGIQFSQDPLPLAAGGNVTVSGTCLTAITVLQISSDNGSTWTNYPVNCSSGSFNLGSMNFGAAQSIIARAVAGSVSLPVKSVRVGSPTTITHSEMRAYRYQTGGFNVEAVVRPKKAEVQF